MNFCKSLVFLLGILLFSEHSLAKKKDTILKDTFESFVATANKIADFENQELRIKRLWKNAVGYALSFKKSPSQFSKADVLNLESYLELSKEKKDEFKKQSPILASIEKEWEAIQNEKQQFQLEKVNEQLDGVRPRYIKEIKRLIADYYEKKRDAPGDLIDILLGLRYEKVEKKIVKPTGNEYGADSIIGAAKEISQTPYDVAREMFASLKLSSHDVFYDMGSGYGRVVLLGGIVQPNVQFRGIEIVPERTQETERLVKLFGLSNVKIQTNDILKSDFTDGTVFYFFNPFPSIMDTVLKKVKDIGKKHKFRIVTFGQSFESLESISWAKKTKNIDSRWGMAIYEEATP